MFLSIPRLPLLPALFRAARRQMAYRGMAGRRSVRKHASLCTETGQCPKIIESFMADVAFEESPYTYRKIRMLHLEQRIETALVYTAAFAFPRKSTKLFRKLHQILPFAP